MDFPGERIGRENLFNKDFNFTGWYMNMRNRFGWTNNPDKSVAKQNVKFTPATFEFVDAGEPLELIGFEPTEN